MRGRSKGRKDPKIDEQGRAVYRFTLNEDDLNVLLEFLHGWDGIWAKRLSNLRPDYIRVANTIAEQKKKQDEHLYPDNYETPRDIARSNFHNYKYLKI